MHEMGREGRSSLLILRSGFWRFGLGLGFLEELYFNLKMKGRRKERWYCF
jgi:hypothetical protein